MSFPTAPTVQEQKLKLRVWLKFTINSEKTIPVNTVQYSYNTDKSVGG